MQHTFGDFVLDEDDVELRREGTPISLQPKVFRLLAYLVRHRERVVPKAELLEQIWPRETVTEASLHSAIKQLRRALAGGDHDWIRTQIGFGYRFLARESNRDIAGGAEHTVLEPVDAVVPSRPRPAARVPFLGRNRELTRITAALAEAIEGRGHVVFVGGDAGIGKTRLAHEVGGYAQAWGAQVLIGRCSEGDGAPAFWPWVQMLRQLAGDSSGYVADILRRLTLGPRAIGSDDSAARDQLEGASSGDREERFALFDSLTQVLLNASRRQPLLCVLDDQQWSDQASLLFLRHLGRAVGSVPMLILGTYRETEVDERHPLADLMVTLQRERHYHHLRLTGLDDADSRALLAASLDLARTKDARESSDLWTEQVVRNAAGNPFFLEEFARQRCEHDEAGRTQGVPSGVRSIIERALTRVDVSGRALLEIAAVGGTDFDVDTLRRASNSGLCEIMAHLDDAAAARLLEPPLEGDGGYRFRHSLIRETLYDALPATRRRELHLAVARALEARRGAGITVHSGELAQHFSKAVPLVSVDEALTHVERAAREAAASLAYEDEERQYDLALRLSTLSPEANPAHHCELLLGRAEAIWNAQDFARIRPAFLEALSLARRLVAERREGAAERFTRAALGLTRTQGRHGVLEVESVALLEEALELLPPTPSALRAVVMARLGWVLYPAASETVRQRELTAGAVEMARALSDSRALMWALHYRHWVLWTPDELGGRFVAARELAEVSERHDSLDMRATAYAWLVFDLIERGSRPELDAMVRSYGTLAEKAGRPWYRWYATQFAVLGAQIDGRYAEAERLAEEALAIWHPVYPDDAMQVYGVQLAAQRLAEGRFGELEPNLAAYAAMHPEVPTWRLAHGLALAETGRFAEAREALEAVARAGFDAIPRDMLWLSGVCLLAELIARLGDRPRAEATRSLLEPFADRCAVLGPVAVTLGPVRYYLARLAVTVGDREAALAWAAAAVEQTERMGMHGWRVPALRAHSAALRLGRRAQDAKLAADLEALASAGAEALGIRLS